MNHHALFQQNRQEHHLPKGSKERVVYFDARTKIHLQNYLDSRTDDNPALFVSLKSPHERLKIGGVEVRLREFGKQLGLNKVHPHKFRRTLATVALDVTDRTIARYISELKDKGIIERKGPDNGGKWKIK